MIPFPLKIILTMMIFLWISAPISEHVEWYAKWVVLPTMIVLAVLSIITMLYVIWCI
jgi:hypothetical protein